MNYDILLFGILSVLALFLIVSFIISMYNHREEIKFYTFLFRDDGKLSKLNITFLFVLPIVLYQAITTSTITTGLLEILWAVFAADLGVKGINKWNSYSSENKKRKSDNEDYSERPYDDDHFRSK